MKKRIITGIVFAALMTGLVAGGCSPETMKTEKKASASTEKKEQMIFDNYGREVAVAEAPKKVLTLGPNCTELFCALGLEDYVIGSSLNNHSRGPLEQYKDLYESIPEINHQSATREAVLSSGADFIYGIDWEFGDEGLDTEELSEYGITAYMDRAVTLEEIYQEIRDIGTIFHVEEKAEAFVEDQENRLKAVSDKVGTSDNLKVLVYDSGNDGVFTCSGTNFETVLIHAAGGENIFADQTEKQWITVSYEEVLAREPDVILIHDYDTPSVEEKIAEIKANPVLANLDCVKNERFAVIELESVLPGDRMAYAAERMAKEFYPELF